MWPIEVGGSSPPLGTDKEVAPQRNPCSPLVSSDILIVSRTLIIWKYCVNYRNSLGWEIPRPALLKAYFYVLAQRFRALGAGKEYDTRS